MSFLALGLMTGTSMDGIDGVLLRTDGHIPLERLGNATLDFDRGFHLALRAAEYALQNEEGDLKAASYAFQTHLHNYLSCVLQDPSQESTIKQSLLLDETQDITLEAISHRLTLLHASVIQTILSKSKMLAEDIAVIGFHGQNLYHHPSKGRTIQLGNGQLLANLTKIKVVNNFREKDINNGGQGAPFAPIYHQALAQSKGVFPIAVVNCGGISNITFIHGPTTSELIGFDVGPGNVLLDRYIRLKTNNQEFMDKDGRYGLKGCVNDFVFNQLRAKSLADHSGDFYAKVPPKSLDTKHFVLIDELFELSIEDACATLEAFTAQMIVDSLKLITRRAPKTWILAGGGWNNPVITRELKSRLIKQLGNEILVVDATAFGWDTKSMEAEIFAYLAVRSLLKLPLSYPETTGVKSPTVGGDVYDFV